MSWGTLCLAMRRLGHVGVRQKKLCGVLFGQMQLQERLVETVAGVKKLGIGKDIRYDPPSMDVMSKTSVQTLFASTVRDCLSESGMSKPMLGRVVLSSKSFPKRCTHVYLVPFANVYVSDGTPIAGRERSAVRFQNCLQLERWPLGSTG